MKLYYMLSNFLKKTNKKALILSLFILIGLISAYVFHFVIHRNEGYPIGTFLFLKEDRFNDFYHTITFSKRCLDPWLSPNLWYSLNYFPMATCTFWILTVFPHTIDLIIFNFVTMSLLFYISKKLLLNTKINNFNLLIIIFLNYGFLINFDRGNPEIVLLILCMFFLYFFRKGFHIKAIICLSLAVAIKLFPIVFSLLYLSKKKYKEFFYTVLLSSLMILIPIIFFKGGYLNNLYFMLNGFESYFSDAFEDNNKVLITGTSLFNLYKFILLQFKIESSNIFFKYVATILIAFLFLSFIIIFYVKTFWKQVTLIACIIISFPHVSFDYKLIYITPCIILFIQNNTQYKNKLYKYFILFCFGVLSIPIKYYNLKEIISVNLIYDVNIGIFIYCIILILLLATISVEQFLSNKIDFIDFKIEIYRHFSGILKNWRLLSLIIIISSVLIYQKKQASIFYTKFKNNYDKAKFEDENYNLKNALIYYKVAYKLHPRKYEIPIKIGRVYGKLNSPLKAKKYFKKAKILYPDYEINNEIKLLNVYTKFMNAKKQQKNKNFNKAIEIFTEIETPVLIYSNVRYNKDFMINFYENFCYCLINENQFRIALEKLMTLSRFDPFNVFFKKNIIRVKKLALQ